jgi:hypothetical protein
MAQQVDSTLNEHPPEVRVLTFAEQIDAGLDVNLGTALGQFRELIVGQATEQADSSKLVGAHHIVAWSLMRSASGRPRRLPRGRQEGRIETSATDYIRAPMTWADCAC